MAEETVVGVGCGRKRAAVQAVGVVIVMDRDRVARRVVPRCVTEPGCADAHNASDEQRNCARGGATKEIGRSHQPCDSTPLAV